MSGVRRSFGLFLVALAFLYGLTAQAIVALAIATLFVVFVVIPFTFHYNKTIQRHMIFLPWVKWPKYVDFDKPEEQGLEGTINFYHKTEDKIKVGVWQIVPADYIEEAKGKQIDWYRQLLSDVSRPVVLYMHGNTGSRARDHRIDMYKFLRGGKLKFHVVCFDYRGYADSSQVVPTKGGVVRDARAVYDYVQKHAGRNPVLVWGHSLGTAVASQMVADLSDEGNAPSALILESPFNNVRDEIRQHPMSYLWRKMPYFDWFFSGSLNKSDVAFFSDAAVARIHIPMLILHAKDDRVVPFELGAKLYEAALDSRRPDSKPVRFVGFEEDRGFAHVQIHQAPELGEVVAGFVDSALNGRRDEQDHNAII